MFSHVVVCKLVCFIAVRKVDGRQSRRITLRGKADNLDAIGARISVDLTKGGTQTSEETAGSGTYIQSSAVTFIGFPTDNPPRQITVRWPDGKVTLHYPNQTALGYFFRQE